MALIDFFKKIEPDKKNSPFLHTVYDGFFTIFYTPDEVTADGGVHMRDGMDLKRLMIHVVIAMQLAYIFGTINIGHQHFAAMGLHPGFLEGLHLKLAYGLIQLLPIFIVSNVVGLAIEFWYAAKKGHAIEEGYLVTGALIPLIVPPDIPLWILTMSIFFAVIIGKEAFGGTGMNILNIALLSRVFIFFAYPTEIAGDTMINGKEVWVSGYEYDAALMAENVREQVTHYGWAHGAFDWIFGLFDTLTFGDGGNKVVDGFTGATPLGLASKGGWEAVTAVYSPTQMLWGGIPGSIGETCKPFILAGAAMLIAIGVGSWRIMLSMFIGAAITAIGMNAWGATPFMEVPWYYQFYMGSFFFAMAFMATDPVTATDTNTGKLIYGFLIGMIGMIIRVMNPAYPEGWMLAILFMNVFAPLIDHYVVAGNMNRRMAKAKKKSVLAVATTEATGEAVQELNH